MPHPTLRRAALVHDMWCAAHRMCESGDMSELDDLDHFQLSLLRPRITAGHAVGAYIDRLIEEKRSHG